MNPRQKPKPWSKVHSSYGSNDQISTYWFPHSPLLLIKKLTVCFWSILFLVSHVGLLVCVREGKRERRPSPLLARLSC